jgi:hypothetical protein
MIKQKELEFICNLEFVAWLLSVVGVWLLKNWNLFGDWDLVIGVYL